MKLFSANQSHGSIEYMYQTKFEKSFKMEFARFNFSIENQSLVPHAHFFRVENDIYWSVEMTFNRTDVCFDNLEETLWERCLCSLHVGIGSRETKFLVRWNLVEGMTAEVINSNNDSIFAFIRTCIFLDVDSFFKSHRNAFRQVVGSSMMYAEYNAFVSDSASGFPLLTNSQPKDEGD